MMKGLARTFVAFSKPALVPGLGLNRKVPSLALAHARRHFGINRKTTFKILPGQDPKEAHSNYADPMEKEEGEIDFRNWLGKFPPKKEEVPFGEWSLESKRCGALGRKMGMMKVWDARGIQIPLTVVRVIGVVGFQTCCCVAFQILLSSAFSFHLNTSLLVMFDPAVGKLSSHRYQETNYNESSQPQSQSPARSWQHPSEGAQQSPDGHVPESWDRTKGEIGGV